MVRFFVFDCDVVACFFIALQISMDLSSLWNCVILSILNQNRNSFCFTFPFIASSDPLSDVRGKISEL